MKTQRLLIGLTLLNLVILIFNVTNLRQAFADDEVAPILRGRALQIVDDQGRVRASITIHPKDTTFNMPDGTIGYPETVMFRLIDPNGRPGVKLGTSADGSGLGLAGDSERRDWSGIQLLAKAKESVVKLTNRDGRVQVLQP